MASYNACTCKVIKHLFFFFSRHQAVFHDYWSSLAKWASLNWTRYLPIYRLFTFLTLAIIHPEFKLLSFCIGMSVSTTLSFHGHGPSLFCIFPFEGKKSFYIGKGFYLGKASKRFCIGKVFILHLSNTKTWAKCQTKLGQKSKKYLKKMLNKTWTKNPKQSHRK